MRSRRKPGARRKPRTRRIARRRTITTQHEPICREERGFEVDRDAADVEARSESVAVGEIGRDDEAGRLLVYKGDVGVADGGGGLVRDLRGGGGRADAARGKGDVLLKPNKGGWDRRAQIRGRVDENGDVGCVKGEGGAESRGKSGDWQTGSVGI